MIIYLPAQILKFVKQKRTTSNTFLDVKIFPVTKTTTHKEYAILVKHK